MDSKKILTHLIRAGRDALNLENMLTTIGYKETPYFNLYGDIAEAVYTLLGENAESFDESITYAVMNDPITSDEACAEELSVLVLPADVPDTTMEVITEAAESRNLPPSTMIRLILNEWAMKEMYSNQVFR